MSDDSIFREVDEAIRHDQLKTLWNKYGIILVSGAFLIIASVSGYKGWVYWQGEQAKTTGARFVGGLTQVEDGKTADALEVFKSISNDAPSGYRTLADFELAALHMKEGKKDEALRIYDELASQSGIGAVLQGFAKIQAASLSLDIKPFAELETRLNGLLKSENSWRHSARELLGLSAYKAGDIKVAERFFNVILSDQQTPVNMRRRAEMMLSLMVQSGGDASDGAK